MSNFVMYLTLILLCLSPGPGSVIVVSGQGLVTSFIKVLDRGDGQECASAEERDRIRNEIDQIANSAIAATVPLTTMFTETITSDSTTTDSTSTIPSTTTSATTMPTEMASSDSTTTTTDMSTTATLSTTTTDSTSTMPSTTTSATTMPSMYTCNGTPGWTRVAFINMTDTSYNCPTGLNLISYSKRTCGRSLTTSVGCSSTTFSVGGLPYSRVCGRIRGYQFGSTSAFWGYGSLNQGIDGYYVDGVSLTHGGAGSRQHIWTFAAGVTEVDTRYLIQRCPCDTHNYDHVPAFVGDDFFCESALHSPWSNQIVLFPDDVLWDGQNCTSTSTCCQLNNPPWFTKNLTSATADDIELRICTDNPPEHTNVPLELIELYVQ